MAAEKYLRPRPIEVAASGPQPSASASRSSRCNRIKSNPPAHMPLSGLFNPEQPAPGSRVGHASRTLSVPAPVCSSRCNSLQIAGSIKPSGLPITRCSAPLLYLHPPRCKHCSRHRYSNRAPRLLLIAASGRNGVWFAIGQKCWLLRYLT